jgi:tetratricopeptide (TPR) repeat protein
MMESETSRHRETHAQGRRQTVLLSLTIVLGLIFASLTTRWMETARHSPKAVTKDEQLYLTGATVKRMSLGFNGLVADWYWMRALQYAGGKVVASGGGITTDLRSLDLHLLAPLLDVAATLDPQFTAVYEYGAIVLPETSDRGSEQAIALLQKGIAANPSTWLLYHHLGYIYWQRGDYEPASRTYIEGAQIPGAPTWMRAMGARMTAEGGSRATAREMYARMREQADDEQTKVMAELHLMRLDSLDERDVIRRVLADHAARLGRCPSVWREVAASLRASRLRLDASSNAPLDPSNAPYVLVKGGCDVDLDPQHSKVPYK